MCCRQLQAQCLPWVSCIPLCRCLSTASSSACRPLEFRIQAAERAFQNDIQNRARIWSKKFTWCITDSMNPFFPGVLKVAELMQTTILGWHAGLWLIAHWSLWNYLASKFVLSPSSVDLINYKVKRCSKSWGYKQAWISPWTPTQENCSRSGSRERYTRQL